MIINFRLSNYKSYGDMQKLSMVPGRYKNNKKHILEREKFSVLKFSSIFGANASGKSNLVDALLKFKNFVVNGKITRQLNPVTFKFGKDTFSKFEVEIGIKEEIYIYGLAVDIQSGLIGDEYLLQQNINSNKLIYSISRLSGTGFEFNKNLVKNSDNEQIYNRYYSDLDIGDLYITKIAKSKIAYPDDFKVKILDVYNWFSQTLQVITPKTVLNEMISQFTDNMENEKVISPISILKSFDTGITNFNQMSVNVNDFIQKANFSFNRETMAQLDSHLLNMSGNSSINAIINGELYRVKLNQHINEKEAIKINFEHLNNKNYSFNFSEESDGTKRLIELINILYMIQTNSFTFVIDELERSFHPNLTLEFVRKFMTYAKNNESQLILGTHEMVLMDLDLFRQDEIWGIERDSRGMSKLFPMSIYKLRSDKVLDKDYLNGRYGAIPQINRDFQ